MKVKELHVKKKLIPLIIRWVLTIPLLLTSGQFTLQKMFDTARVKLARVLHMAETTFTDKHWYENFRVSRETLRYIVSEVKHEIRRQDTMFRKAVCPSTKVAILLYYLGSIAEYRTIANLFGVSKSYVSLCIKEVALAIVRKLKTSFLFVPKGEDLKVMKIYREK